MPKITWAHVAVLFLLVLLILGIVALLGSEKNLEIKASTNEISLKTSEAQETFLYESTKIIVTDDQPSSP
jgi:hypothetical protein